MLSGLSPSGIVTGGFAKAVGPGGAWSGGTFGVVFNNEPRAG